MTLVVVQHKGNVISAVADTGVMEHGSQLPPDKQLPKICILTPDLAVAFAGNPDLAIRYLGNFPEGANYKTTIDYLLGCHLNASRQVDFLVLFNKPSKIVPIREGKTLPPAKAAWLGDQSAFEVFQRYRNTRKGASITSVFEAPQLISICESEAHQDNVTFQMLGALRYVIIDQSRKSVFGQAVAVNNVDEGFQYRSYTFVLVERQFHLQLPLSFLKQVAPERAELRDYAASCFVTGENFDVQGVAYHFVHGKLTYMYWGRRGKPLSSARIVVEKNIAEFMDDTKQEFGIEWTGTLTLRTPPPPNYGIPLDRWKRDAPTGRRRP